MKFKLMAGAAMAAAFAASGAAAQPGWYGALDLGYHWPESRSYDTAAGGKYDIRTESDWTGFGRVGYQLTDNWRVEAEVGYRPGDVKTVINTSPAATGVNSVAALCRPGVIRTAAAANCGNPDGDQKTWTVMAHASAAPHRWTASAAA